MSVSQTSVVSCQKLPTVGGREELPRKEAARSREAAVARGPDVVPF